MATRKAADVAPPTPAGPPVHSLPWQQTALQQALATLRGHALLLHGAAGDGSLEFAWALGRAMLCEASERPGGLACGHCTACRAIQNHLHPDFRVLVPEATALARGWPVATDERRKPSRWIRVDDVRAAIDWVHATSGRGQGKVLLLHPAETLNEIAANALLKTLEEPAPGTRVLLTAAQRSRLLPTVLSRCQSLELPKPSAAEAQAWLMQTAGLSAADAQVVLAATSGHPLEAADWAARGTSAAQWLRIPAAIAAGDAAIFQGWRVPDVVDALLKLCHDALCVAQGLPAQARFFPQASLPAQARAEPLLAWRRECLRVAEHADHPWNEPLLIDALVAQGQWAWQAARPARPRPDKLPA